MSPGVRQFALTAHVVLSVGWLGAVGVFLALAVAGLTSADPEVVRAAYLATDVITWYVIVPLAFAALVSGVVQSLGTTWGLVRHYWVLAKLLITVLATILLLVHTQPIAIVASAAAEGPLTHAERPLQVQLLGDAAAALIALLVATTLSVYKPRGVTRYGWRKQQEERSGAKAEA
jgi:hypothetical protein